MKDWLHRRLEANGIARLDRRGFVAMITGAVGATAVVRVLTACGGDHVAAPATAQGTVRGTVKDVQGNPQAIGRIYLLLKSGENQNLYADVDAKGAFNFGAVDVGSYQLRYWGGAQASVPEPNPNPVRIDVTANAESVVDFTIALGNPDANVQEIYAGDNFFQQQPFGDLNGTVTVKLGTIVCWYNVGVNQHTVTGGPWGDSGVIGEADEFMWTANQVGTFGYRCSFHNPQMQAILNVIA
jgi:plastocyanin